ncbi:sugar ABC transporter permease, partial [Candidatus Aerophobetes bacterium]|nr:sugar ABC transporter permease [Candidatus Aerophobetes bacterium]
PSPFVGLSNFRLLFSDPIFYISFRNVAYYTTLNLTLTFIIPIIIAILLMEMRKDIIRIMMILWFIPTASMAGMVIWKWFYNPYYGLFNAILKRLGFPPLRWLNDPNLAMFCLVLPGLIMFGPGLIYIASIQSIPEEFYEAAELEGTSFWQKVWHITLPRLRPIIAMMLILAIINNLQVFNPMKVMTGGGPANATISPVMHIFNLAFERYKMGIGSAMSIILFFLVLSLITIQRKFFKENIDK